MTTSLNTRVLQPYPEVPLTVTDTGRGRPVLVLHGGGGPASVEVVVQHLCATRRVIAPVHPGWDKTPRPDWFVGVDSLVETYLDLLDDFDLRDVTVVGSSFGGWLAAEMAVRDRGRRLGHLVLVDAAGPRIDGHSFRLPGLSSPFQAPMSTQDGAPAAPLSTMLAYAGPDLQDPKLLTRLSRVQVPALVLWGEHDTVLTPDYGRAYAAAIPAARFQLIEGASHVPTREKPEAVLATVDAFLAATGGNRSSR